MFNPPLGSVHAFVLTASLQCAADEEALASTAYSVAGLRSVREHSSGFREAAASQDFPPPDTLYSVTPEPNTFGVTVTLSEVGDRGSIVIA